MFGGRNNIIEFSNRSNRAEKPLKRKLLCLVDSDAARENLVKKLDRNFDLIQVSTIFNALQSLKTDIPSGLIVQLHLKDENCFDFLRMIASNPFFEKLPIITCCVDDVFDKNIEEYLIKATRFMGSNTYISCAEFYSSALGSKVSTTLNSRTIPIAS